MGVRNKYCSTCAHAERENKAPQEHDCYKNWDGLNFAASMALSTQRLLVTEIVPCTQI